jgi:hypothetical protein
MTAQEVIAMASPEETKALEAYFGPNWVYRALKQEEEKPQHGLQFVALTTEGERIKGPAREAWEHIKADHALWVSIGLREPKPSWLPSNEEGQNDPIDAIEAMSQPRKVCGNPCPEDATCCLACGEKSFEWLDEVPDFQAGKDLFKEGLNWAEKEFVSTQPGCDQPWHEETCTKCGKLMGRIRYKEPYPAIRCEACATQERDFPRLGKLPWLNEDPHAELGRIRIDGMVIKCTCGSRAWVGQGIASSGDLAAQCFNCREEAEFPPSR